MLGRVELDEVVDEIDVVVELSVVVVDDTDVDVLEIVAVVDVTVVDVTEVVVVLVTVVHWQHC